jgi:hypothetical protein
LAHSKSYEEVIGIINQFFESYIGKKNPKFNDHLDYVSRIIMNKPEDFNLENWRDFPDRAIANLRESFFNKLESIPNFSQEYAGLTKQLCSRKNFLKWIGSALP